MNGSLRRFRGRGFAFVGEGLVQVRRCEGADVWLDLTLCRLCGADDLLVGVVELGEIEALGGFYGGFLRAAGVEMGVRKACVGWGSSLRCRDQWG